MYFPPLENTICPLGGGAWNQKSFLHFDISISYFSLATQKLKWPKEIFEAPSVHLSGTYLFPTVSEQRSAFSIQDFFAPPQKKMVQIDFGGAGACAHKEWIRSIFRHIDLIILRSSTNQTADNCITGVV